MRFMMFIKIEQDGYGEPAPDDVGAMMRYNEELTQAGALLALDGLQPPSMGATVTFGDDRKPTVVDGPFAEAKEVIGGYWIIQTKSKEEAVEWAKRVPADPGQVIEVRQVFEMSDFSDEVREAAGELSSPPPQQPVGDL
ncbi:MAG TPA: YciI family protein [Baekduia sp.]